MPYKRHSKWNRRRHYKEPYKRRCGSKAVAGVIIGVALILGLALYSGVLQVNQDVLERSVGEINEVVSKDDTNTDAVVTIDDSGSTGIRAKVDIREPSEAPLHDRPEQPDAEVVGLTGMPIEPEGSHDEMVYLEELYDYALLLVNEDRTKHGLRPVELSSTASGQAHTDEMLRHDYYSHWYIDGTKPHVSYTRHGGHGAVFENICMQYTGTDHMAAIRKCQYLMVYDDAHADWGHRDNILDPHRTHVNFGISFDGSALYFVQHFENNLIDMSRLEINDSILVLEGSLMPGYGIYGINIYEDPEPKQLTGRIIETESPYADNYYDFGVYTGMIVEESPWSYTECSPGMLMTFYEHESACIPYSTYRMERDGNDSVRLTADVSIWLEQDGFHTMHIFLTAPTGDAVVGSTVTLEYI